MPTSPRKSAHQQLVAEEIDGITHEIVTITPTIAAEWLTANTHNRNLRDRSVNAYARDIENGDWELTGEAIKRAADGTLLDGQHRLAAVVKANKPIKALVVSGIPLVAQSKMDTGIPRRFADQLGFAGEPAPQIMSAVLRRIVLWEAGFYTKNTVLRPTNAEMEAALERFPYLRESVRYGVRQAIPSGMHASLVSFSHWLLGAIDYEEMLWFLDRAADGVGLPANHPVLTLRDRIRRERDLNRGRGADPNVSLALVIYAWNAHRAGERRVKLQLPKGGLTNDVFPMPK